MDGFVQWSSPMATPRSVLLLPALLLLGAACAPGGDELGSSDGEEDAVEQGDEDLVGTRRGSELGSAFAKATSSYYPSRTIATLEKVSALDAETRAALLRADGIIAAQPSDGKVSLEELVRLEAPEFDRVLLPGERAGRARAWRLMEAPKNKQPAYLPAAGAFAPVVNVVRAPGKIDRRESIPLAKVSADVALVRLQQAYDVDGKKTTIAMVDCDEALAAPGPFTPAEIEIIRTARDTIARQLLAPGTARLEVEAPKKESKVLGTVAGIKLRQVRTTSYGEERGAPSGGGMQVSRFAARRDSVVRFEGIPADATLVSVRVTALPFGPTGPFTIDEVATPTPAVDPETNLPIAGAYDWSGAEGVVEIWRGGRRRSAVSLAKLHELGYVALERYTDFDLVAAGKVLAKNAVSADARASTVRFAYQGTAAPPSGGATQADVDRLATPPIDLTKLPLGEYVYAPNPNHRQTIEVLTDKVVFDRVDQGATSQWLPAARYDYRMLPGIVPFTSHTGPGFTDDTGSSALDPVAGYIATREGNLRYRYLWKLDAATRTSR